MAPAEMPTGASWLLRGRVLRPIWKLRQYARPVVAAAMIAAPLTQPCGAFADNSSSVRAAYAMKSPIPPWSGPASS